MRWWLRQNSRKRIHYLAPASLVTAAAATTARTGSLPLRDLPVRAAAAGPPAGNAGPIAGDAVRLLVKLPDVQQCLPLQTAAAGAGARECVRSFYYSVFVTV